MRNLITKTLAVVTALSCVFALVVPERAYAYDSFPRTEVTSAWSAGYAFLAERYPEIPYDDAFKNGDYGGFPGAADFVATIVTAPSSPFMLWVHNYVYFWFSEWRVQTYDDLPDDSEAQQRLIDQQLDAAEFIIREWNIWKEKFPGAGGGSSDLLPGETAPSFDASPTLHIIYLRSPQVGTYYFDDGTPLTVGADAANLIASRASKPYAFFSIQRSKPSTALSFSPTSFDVDTCFVYVPSDGNQTNGYGFGVSPGTQVGTATVSGTSQVSPYAPYSPLADCMPAWATSMLGSTFNWRYRSNYLVTNMEVYTPTGNYIPGPDIDPSAPVGPTAPDIQSPETPVITNPVSPTIPLTFTDTGNTYTGNETDYSDYLQIIIDNQNTQIDQLKALSNGIVQIWDNYMGWLDSEFDAVYHWFEHFNANWNTLFEWLHTIAEDLFSIDQTFTSFRNEVTDYLERIVTVLYRILDKIALRYSPDNPNPSINIEPGSGLDISDPLMTWIKGIIDNILAAISAGIAGLIGTATSSIGNLSNLFPFSLLFDLSLMLGLLNHEPVAPVFDIPYPFSANENAVLVHVDLSPWTPVMQTLRPMWVLLFALGLVYLSIDMIMALYNFLYPGGDN